MDEFKIKTVMDIKEEEEGAVEIVLKIKGFPNKMIAGLYAAQLMSLRDDNLHEDETEYNLLEEGTIH